MKKIASLLSTVFILGGCAYAIDTQNQKFTVMTPGAEGAVCFVYIEDLKYKFNPPETQNIFKSPKDMRIDCLAPGNRRKEVVVKSKIANSGYLNVLNGGLAVPWDYTSGALFRYPDVVEVSFVDIPQKPSPLPWQDHPNIKSPGAYNLEEFSPETPSLNADKDIPVNELRRRQKGGGFVSETISNDSFSEGLYSGGGKGNLRDAGASASPTPLFPGE